MPALPPPNPTLTLAFEQASQGQGPLALETLRSQRELEDRLAVRASGWIAAIWGTPEPRLRFELISNAVSSGAGYLTPRLLEAVGALPDVSEAELTEVLEQVEPGAPVPDLLQPVQHLIGQQKFELASRAFQALDELPPWPDSMSTKLRSRIDRLNKEVAAVERSVGSTGKSAEETIGDAIASVNTGIQEFQEDTDEARALLQHIASQGLSEEYETHAARDRRSATWFTAAAIAVGFVSAAVAIKFGGDYIEKTDSPSPFNVFARTGLALPLIVVAAYLGSLAGKYRRMSWHWTNISLQLQAFRPFIQRLDREDQLRVTAMMVPRFFPGQPLDIHGEGQNPNDDGSAFREFGASIHRSPGTPAT